MRGHFKFKDLECDGTNFRWEYAGNLIFVSGKIHMYITIHNIFYLFKIGNIIFKVKINVNELAIS